MGYGGVGHEGVARRHEDLLCIVQIESRAALDAVDEIAGVEGVDALFVGPTDLTHALGIPGRIDRPEYQAAVSRVGRAATAAGKAAGVLVWNPEDVGGYADEGFTFFAISSEVNILDRAIRAQLDSAHRVVAAAKPEVS
jgi:2-keto-3-deoxy-L-rhamnonate aldolase RhmA